MSRAVEGDGFWPTVYGSKKYGWDFLQMKISNQTTTQSLTGLPWFLLGKMRVVLATKKCDRHQKEKNNNSIMQHQHATILVTTHLHFRKLLWWSKDADDEWVRLKFAKAAFEENEKMIRSRPLPKKLGHSLVYINHLSALPRSSDLCPPGCFRSFLAKAATPFAPLGWEKHCDSEMMCEWCAKPFCSCPTSDGLGFEVQGVFNFSKREERIVRRDMQQLTECSDKASLAVPKTTTDDSHSAWDEQSCKVPAVLETLHWTLSICSTRIRVKSKQEVGRGGSSRWVSAWFHYDDFIVGWRWLSCL